MEPANAAAIMEKLKIETVVTILRYMKGKSAGLILGQMKPDLGAAISEKLSQMDD
jgi:flagellar motility protein MotE (MotC chaperone)